MPSRSSCSKRQKRGERRYHVLDVSTIPLSSTLCSPSWKAANKHSKRGNGDTRSTLPSAAESSSPVSSGVRPTNFDDENSFNASEAYSRISTGRSTEQK